jgi:hypothetical protein
MDLKIQRSRRRAFDAGMFSAPRLRAAVTLAK